MRASKELYINWIEKMQIRIPDEVIQVAKSKEDIDEILRVLWDAVRYKLTWQIVDKWLLELLDPNTRRAKKMIGNKNSVKQTEKQTEADCKQSAPHWKTECPTLKKQTEADYFITDENWLNQEKKDSWGFIYTNNILLNIINTYIDNNITYPSINYQIKKLWKEKYLIWQIEEAEKLIKKIWFQTFQVIIQYLPHDDFWSKNILSIAKLGKKNKDWIPYYAVIMDRIKQFSQKNLIKSF